MLQMLHEDVCNQIFWLAVVKVLVSFPIGENFMKHFAYLQTSFQAWGRVHLISFKKSLD